MTDVDAVVIGAGVMGSATARALARAGREVLLLEQFEVGHTRGSSHGRSRIFRFSYPDPMYVRMAMDALPLWRELETESGEEIVRTTGGLDAGKALEEHVAALGACGAAHRVLSPQEAGRRFPFLSFPDGPVLLQPDAGVIRADRAVAAFVRSARGNGAGLRERARVTAVRPAGDRAEVRTDGETYRARVAVVTAGGWARGLLAGAGIDLPVRVTRETVAYFRLDEDLPVPTLVDWGRPAVYALPSPGQGLKAGEHIAGPETDPEEEGTPSEASVARLQQWVSRRYPSAEPEPHLVETCLYTNTEDERFILERHGPIVLGSPCSGHGFKFAPLIGERLAAMAGPGRT